MDEDEPVICEAKGCTRWAHTAPGVVSSPNLCMWHMYDLDDGVLELKSDG